MPIAANRTTNCRGCGQLVMFIRTKDNETIGLDLAEPVYTRVWDPDSDKGFWMQDKSNEAFVRHTCPPRSK